MQGNSEKRTKLYKIYSEGASQLLTQQNATSAGRVAGSARKQVSTARKSTVFVGLSGGVDSSVAALLLKQQGYEVIGVYMKNWSKDLPGMPCPWKEDYQDAKRVAVQLGIDFKVYDFEKAYFKKVVKYMLEGYKAGFTPNPDIMCNQEIKFKLFLETALEDGADYIATGHYARVKNGKLLMAYDRDKDQTYFLHRAPAQALTKTIFPLGELTKPQVRQIAKKAGLATANKKESMGICFIGKVGIKEFLEQYISQKPGKIIGQNGWEVGQHEGAFFYTIGQRHGLDVGGGLPYYVTGKNMQKNEVYVTTDLQDEKLWSNTIHLNEMHWISPFQGHSLEKGLMVRIRHRSKLIPAKLLNKSSNLTATVELEEDVRALTPGQSAVFYSGGRVLGGGIVV
ncbi:tRNA 2-thiouridine(34) synthase MnmA [Candidatus Saccharibacteria bacterium]|nr:tRNA 2-thiouridine(34) synthase MnmA [Candidatus Saccharibacteria bacterium]